MSFTSSWMHLPLRSFSHVSIFRLNAYLRYTFQLDFTGHPMWSNKENWRHLHKLFYIKKRPFFFCFICFFFACCINFMFDSLSIYNIKKKMQVARREVSITSTREACKWTLFYEIQKERQSKRNLILR